MFKIGILQLTAHLDAAVEGFKEAFKDVDTEFIYYNVEGKVPELKDYAAKLQSENVDLIFGCTTPAAKAAKNLLADIPVLFTPVFDPVTTGLVTTPDKPEGKVTGVCGQVKAQDKLLLIKELMPKASHIVILMDSDDPNSAIETDNFTKAATDFMVRKIVVDRESLKNLNNLVPNSADLIFLPIGPVVEQNFTLIKQFADSRKLPIIASHGPNVEAGAIAALIADHRDLGRTCGQMAKKLLTGEKTIADLPVAYPDAPKLIINQSACEQAGVVLTEGLKKRAIKIYG